MTPAQALEWLKKWGFATALLVLTAWSSAAGLSLAPTPPAPPRESERTPHHPAPGEAEPNLRNPFLTGTDWRAFLRAQMEASSVAARPHATPPEPPPAVEGTMMSPERLAVTQDGMYKEGATIGKFRIEKIFNDRVVFSKEGKEYVVKVAEGN